MNYFFLLVQHTSRCIRPLFGYIFGTIKVQKVNQVQQVPEDYVIVLNDDTDLNKEYSKKLEDLGFSTRC